VVDRATVKDPSGRYPEMASMLDDLESALEVEIARAGSSTGEATNVLRSVPARRRRIFTPRSMSFAGIAIVLIAAAVALGIAALTGEEGPSREEGEGGAGPILASSATDFDPEGGDGEHSEEVRFAIDGNPTGTGWSTESYPAGLAGAPKSGVGLYVDAEEPVAASELKLVTTTPGWSGEVYAAVDGPPEELAGWGDPVATIEGAEEDETVALDLAGSERYYLIWITDLGDNESVEISDVRLRG
jgi:eukaryotic-like serine/threonine-protein kinase